LLLPLLEPDELPELEDPLEEEVFGLELPDEELPLNTSRKNPPAPDSLPL